MAWAFEDDQTEEGTGTATVPQKQANGWTFEDDQPETSYLRAFGGAAKEIFTGGLNIAAKMLGGGPESMMVQEEGLRIRKEQEAFDLKEQELQSAGLEEEEITEQLGPRIQQLSLSEAVDKLTGLDLEAKTPTERVIQEAGKTAGEFVTMNAMLPFASSLAGLGREVVTGGLFGVGSQLAAEDGEGPLGQLAQGALFAAAPFMAKKGVGGIQKALEWGKRFTKAGALPSGMPKFVEEAGSKAALADLELSSKDLAGRTAKLSQETVAKFEDLVGKPVEPGFRELGPVRMADIENEVIKANETALLDTISPGESTPKKSWEGVQKYVEGNFKAQKKTYSELYDVVEDQAKNIKSPLPATREISRKLYSDLKQSIIHAPEEGGVKSALQAIVKTLKPKLPKKFKGLGSRKLNKDLAERAAQEVEVPLSRTLASKRSINRLLKKSDITPAPVDLLRPVAKAMKEDILGALENTALGEVYQAAETQFAEGQRIFNNDAIRKFRKTQSAEEMTEFFSKPSNIQKLKEAVGDSKKVQDFTDRIIVENIASKNKNLAREMAQESREFISSKANKVLEQLLEYGDSLTTPGQQALTRGTLSKSIQKAAATGSRPTEALNIMKTDIGYKLAKDTLNRSPKGKKIFESLQKMTFEDMMGSIIGENKQIDFEKAKDIFANPHLKTIVKDALGEEGLKFFQGLETYGNNMADNLRRFQSRDPSIFKKVLDAYLGSKLKYLLFAISPKSAAVGIVGAEGIKRAHRALLYRAMADPKTRNIIKQMGQKNVSPEAMKSLIKRFGQVAGTLERKSQEEDE